MGDLMGGFSEWSYERGEWAPAKIFQDWLDEESWETVLRRHGWEPEADAPFMSDESDAEEEAIFTLVASQRDGPAFLVAVELAHVRTLGYIIVADLPSLLQFYKDFGVLNRWSRSDQSALRRTSLEKRFHIAHGHGLEESCRVCDPQGHAANQIRAERARARREP